MFDNLNGGDEPKAAIAHLEVVRIDINFRASGMNRRKLARIPVDTRQIAEPVGRKPLQPRPGAAADVENRRFSIHSRQGRYLRCQRFVQTADGPLAQWP